MYLTCFSLLAAALEVLHAKLQPAAATGHDFHLPRITARMDPAWSMGPSFPMTKLLATPRALPMTFATNVLIVKKFLKIGLSTPFRYAFTSGIPDPEAAGEIRNSDKLQENASRRLKPMYWKNLGIQASWRDCRNSEAGKQQEPQSSLKW